MGERFLRVRKLRFSVFRWLCGASGGHFQANRRAAAQKKKCGPSGALFLLLAAHVIVTCIELFGVATRDTDLGFKVLFVEA